MHCPNMPTDGKVTCRLCVQMYQVTAQLRLHVSETRRKSTLAEFRSAYSPVEGRPKIMDSPSLPLHLPCPWS